MTLVSRPIFVTSSSSSSTVTPRFGTPDTSWDGLEFDFRFPSPIASPTPDSEANLFANVASGLDRGHLSPPDLQLQPTAAVASSTHTVGFDLSDLGAVIESAEHDADEQRASPETLPLTPGTLRPSEPSQSRLSPRRRSNRRASDRDISYDFDNEELPQHQLYSLEVQQALRKSKSFMGNLSAVLSSSTSRMHEDRGSMIHDLHAQAAALAKFELPPSWTVGFVGGTGTGKSSLLNSLLHQKNLATERNGGRACTSVVTEFRYREGSSFTIATELFDEDKLVEQLAGLLRTYRSFHMPEPATCSPHATRGSTISGSTEGEEQVKTDAAKDAKQALSMLWTFFGKKIERHMPLLLEEDEDQVLAVLSADLLDNRHALATDEEVFATAETCASRLTELTVDPRSKEDNQPPDDPVVWPYIRTIHVYLDSRILSKGLVLVDLPGLGDRNAAREAVTESYLVRCDEIFAVNHIGRAVSSSGGEHVIDLARQAKLSNIGIICTHAEEFGNERIEVAERPRASQIRQLLQRIQILKQEIQDLECDLYDSECEDGFLNDNLSRAALQEKFELQSSIRRKEREKATCESNILQFRIEDRNEAVEREMKSTYREKLPGGIQNVFCVGNVLYWNFWEKGRSVQEVHLSGIPRLRRHCLAKVADSQLKLAAKHICESIPALLSEVELWIEAGAQGPEAEQKRAIREALDKIEGELTMDLIGRNTLTSALSESLMRMTFDEKIYRNLRCNQPTQWSNAARTASREWDCWHSQTYIAFCGHHGTYTTKAVGWHSWNEEAMASMVKDLKQPWIDVRQHLQECHSQSVLEIEKLTDSKVVQMEKLPFPALLRTVRARNSALASDLMGCIDTFESALRTLGVKAFSGMRTGLFGMAMENDYNAARQIYGTGCTARKRHIINGALRKPSLFSGVMHTFRDEYVTHARFLEEEVSNAIDGYLQGLKSTLDMIRDDVAASESEADSAFTARVEASVAAAKIEIESLRNVFSWRSIV